MAQPIAKVALLGNAPRNTCTTKTVKMNSPLHDSNAEHDRTGSYSVMHCKGVTPELHTWSGSSATKLCDRDVTQEI